MTGGNMGVELLDKTRKINKLLHNSNSTKVVFNDICEVLGETLSSNVLVISRKGKVLGLWNGEEAPVIGELLGDEVGSMINPLLDNRLLDVLSTRENVDLRMFGFDGDGIENYKAIINPIEIAGERLGTVFSYRNSAAYDIDDIIVSEYGTTVVALAMIRSVDEETAHEQRLRGIVTSAFSTLSVSETDAIVHIFDELNGQEGILVASRVADRIGITRSVIVNALRKFESAGIIESRSSGMKGTYIKVLNPYVDEEIERVRLRARSK